MKDTKKLPNKPYHYKKLHKGFKTLVKKWMLTNNALRVDIEGKKVYAYQHKTGCDYDTFIHLWLDGDITSKALTQFLKEPYQWVQYYFDDFLEMIQND